ncbi:hypothetical protein K469DRAFT_686909 [Zopfia rhizophila CBS 207.26]|uniref:Uncharacterized protein n=1 Tax=Zopfia rhizophila CBS 207.26 TaxID=1314779 RepID=A0A6A6E3X5_9PEZI|nr:hypothetical protein K469DRAFT_686909 [Zopfia rhizophila CBS 207.26]
MVTDIREWLEPLSGTTVTVLSRPIDGLPIDEKSFQSFQNMVDKTGNKTQIFSNNKMSRIARRLRRFGISGTSRKGSKFRRYSIVPDIWKTLREVNGASKGVQNRNDLPRADNFGAIEGEGNSGVRGKSKDGLNTRGKGGGDPSRTIPVFLTNKKVYTVRGSTPRAGVDLAEPLPKYSSSPCPLCQNVWRLAVSRLAIPGFHVTPPSVPSFLDILGRQRRQSARRKKGCVQKEERKKAKGEFVC